MPAIVPPLNLFFFSGETPSSPIDVIGRPPPTPLCSGAMTRKRERERGRAAGGHWQRWRSTSVNVPALCLDSTNCLLFIRRFGSRLSHEVIRVSISVSVRFVSVRSTRGQRVRTGFRSNLVNLRSSRVNQSNTRCG
ncbi:hypothetical protein HanXRQr2_Chr13g0565431 [Helianthus annuus]|uniref:Uncharacterized protein n=1 Tax=Helianthus annuus TaxID=4232 RepID=A0A251SNG2_HELAN|nr:hypothetical protein HanXRQr2_Chr13g0565431 [Helianthus annuus]